MLVAWATNHQGSLRYISHMFLDDCRGGGGGDPSTLPLAFCIEYGNVSRTILNSSDLILLVNEIAHQGGRFKCRHACGTLDARDRIEFSFVLADIIQHVGLTPDEERMGDSHLRRGQTTLVKTSCHSGLFLPRHRWHSNDHPPNRQLLTELGGHRL